VESSPTKEEILEALTGGWIPIEYCFLLRGSICWWNPELKMVMQALLDDPCMPAACRSFLQKRGACYETSHELEEVAVKNNWQNWIKRGNGYAGLGE
jgi:hypothetical protein